MPDLSKDDIIDSLHKFKRRREALLLEDISTFEHHLERFLQFCRRDPLLQRVLNPIEKEVAVDLDDWWTQYDETDGNLQLPSDEDEEVLLRLRPLEEMDDNSQRIYHFGIVQSGRNRSDHISLVRSLIIRPLVEELSRRIGDEAEIASPEAREVQAVPFERIPVEDTTRIFLSHKSVDKAIVRRYYNALDELGFSPWIDEADLPAGKKLERGILRGFEESCAAVFFITENFDDENYLASEVDYARMQKREKGDNFTVITLLYPGGNDVPGLLKPFVYKAVSNDLEGFYEVVRALPIELGQPRWKEHVV